MLTVNQLCRDLGIKHPDDHRTCIGYGKAKPTCGNPVAAQSRSTAVWILENICSAIEDGVRARDLASDLNTAACLLHCKRWHQSQGPAMSQDWERKLHYARIQRHEEENQQSRRLQHRQTSSQPVGRGSRLQPSSRPTPQPIEPARDLAQYERDLLEIQAQTSHVLTSMLSILDQYRRSGQPLRLLPAASTIRQASSQSHVDTDYNGNMGSLDSGSVTTNSSSSSSSVPVHRTSVALTFDPEQLSRMQQQGSTSRTSSESRSSPTPSTSSISGSPRIPSPSPSSSSSSSSSGDAGDCGVCLEPLPRTRGRGRSSHRRGVDANINNNNNSIWTCEVCRNSAHVECFNLWLAHSTQNNVRCIYWYVLWLPISHFPAHQVSSRSLSLLLLLTVAELSGINRQEFYFIPFLGWDSSALHACELT